MAKDSNKPFSDALKYKLTEFLDDEYRLSDRHITALEKSMSLLLNRDLVDVKSELKDLRTNIKHIKIIGFVVIPSLLTLIGGLILALVQ